MPRSLVRAECAAIIVLVSTVGGTAALQPLDGAGGSGVVVLTAGDRNVRSMVDMLTLEGKRLAMVQEYQPWRSAWATSACYCSTASRWVLSCACRAKTTFAPNIHAGGQVRATDLTERERELVTSVAPKLREYGLFFVGLDLIGEKLIEVNVTSPTGIQELGRHLGTRPEEDVIG